MPQSRPLRTFPKIVPTYPFAVPLLPSLPFLFFLGLVEFCLAVLFEFLHEFLGNDIFLLRLAFCKV